MKAEFLKKQQDTVFQIETDTPARRARDFRVEVLVTNGDMIAAVKIIALNGDNCPVTEFDILSRLYSAGVRVGIDYDLIENIISSKRYHEEIPIAYGVQPARGQDARIEPRVHLEEFTTAELLKQFPGQVIRRGVPVDLDEVMAEKIPADAGRAGYTVRGRKLEPAPGADAAFVFGDGARLSADGLQLVAAMPGMAGLSDGKIAVKDAEYEAWKYDVKLRKGNMEAVLTIVPGLTAQPAHDAEWFQALVEEHGLGFGVERDSWRMIPDRLRSTYVRVIARGEPPLPGEDAYIKEHYRETAEPGQAVFKVAVDQLLAEKIPPRKGARGRDVLDKPVEPSAGVDLTLVAGPGTRLSDDGLTLLADASGMVARNGEAWLVAPVSEYHAPGSLPGKLNSAGAVRITGNVPPGHVIVAAHHVEILGDLVASDVVAGGILHVHGQVVNCVRNKVQSGGHMHLGGVEKSRVRAGGHIYLGGAARESDFIAGGGLFCANGVALSVAGGRVLAVGGAEFMDLGAAQTLVTTLLLGAPMPLRTRYDHAAREIIDLINKFGAVNGKLLPLHKLLIAKKLPRDQVAMYRKLRVARDALAERIRVGKATVAKLKDAMAHTSRGTTAQVRGAAYPGVAVRIGTQRYRVDKRIKNCIFSQATNGDFLEVVEIQ
jgi:uncharacterized protein (DUF342 family)